jgi:hypothetical protein
MAIRLDQLPRDTQQQIMARLEEQGLLVREPFRRHVKQEPPGDRVSWLKTVALVIGYATAALGALGLFLLQASGSDLSNSYPLFFARVFVYVARGSWAIIKENAVPFSGNVAIAAIFVLGMFKALQLAVWIVRKAWPVLVAVGVALIVLKLQAA